MDPGDYSCKKWKSDEKLNCGGSNSLFCDQVIWWLITEICAISSCFHVAIALAWVAPLYTTESQNLSTCDISCDFVYNENIMPLDSFRSENAPHNYNMQENSVSRFSTIFFHILP